MTELLSEPVIRHTGLVIFLVAFIHLSRWLLTYQAQRAADKWTAGFKREETEGHPSALAQAPMTPERVRLQQQMAEIERRARHHLDVTVFFYTRYYMAITLFSVVGGIAAIALIFITKAGWHGVSPYVITIFLVMSGHAAFYGAFPKIFRQEQNIADNKKLYVRYVALQNELESYFTTGESMDGHKRTEKDFIHYLDQQLGKLNNLAIGFDYSKVPSYKEAFESPKS